MKTSKFLLVLILLFLSNFLSFSQEKEPYQFQQYIDNVALPVISQGRSGTCWSFATSSFLESEVYRINGFRVDLSEMYPVRITYEAKAWNYVMRQGKTQFSEGGLAHDVLNAVRTGGLVPDEDFAKKTVNGMLNHSGLIKKLKKVLDAYIDNPEKTTDWKKEINKILDEEVGKKPSVFTYGGKTYTPESFARFLHINPEDYITLTSFTHRPYYDYFILNIPDNFSNGSFYNLPLNEMTRLTIEALEKGYTVSLDADVSEATFSPKYGLAVLPENENDKERCMTEIVKEISPTPLLRQQAFENFGTTDDHLMHITGLVKDSKGNLYFKVKNSWGGNSDRVGNDGYIYMSIPYFQMKAISVLLHKSALPSYISAQ